MLQTANLDPENNYGNPSLCEKLQAMAISDQRYRGPIEKPLERYPLVLDSLIKARGYTKQTFELLPALEQGKIKHLSFKLLSRHLTPKVAENKSFARKQKVIDAANTRALIKIVKKMVGSTERASNAMKSFELH